MKDNHYVPLVSNIHFTNVSGVKIDKTFDNCVRANTSKCYNITIDGKSGKWKEKSPAQTFGCKRNANPMFGKVSIKLPWGVCIPFEAPVNLRPDYPNWGEISGKYNTLAECIRACTVT